MGASIEHLVKPHVNSGTSDIYAHTFVEYVPDGPGIQAASSGSTTLAGISDNDLNHADDQPFIPGEDAPTIDHGGRVWLLAGEGGLAAGDFAKPGTSVVGIGDATNLPNAGVKCDPGDTANFKVGDDAPTAADGELTWGDMILEGVTVPEP